MRNQHTWWQCLIKSHQPSKIFSLGLEFWLPLPLIGISIWLGGKSVANQMLSYAYDTSVYLEANHQVIVQLSIAVLAIEAEIKQQTGFTKVSVKTADSAIKTLEIELPTIDIAAVEIGIGKELGLDSTTVKRLTRYQFTE
ncbi:MAG: hypothetical protein AB3A66_23845 [Nodularia sp. CChRGM 3473]